MERELFDAFHNQDIPLVHLMNRLFRGPRILFGYYQGGLIVELIQKRYGFDKALELLRGFGDDLGLQETFDRAIGMSSRQFDKLLLDYVEKDLLRGIKLLQSFFCLCRCLPFPAICSAIGTAALSASDN